jgi:hypothetical protein
MGWADYVACIRIWTVNLKRERERDNFVNLGVCGRISFYQLKLRSVISTNYLNKLQKIKAK